MKEISRFAFACCAVLGVSLSSCSDEGPGSTSDSRKLCGDSVCTETQYCDSGVCRENDPCAKCTAAGLKCENGVCVETVKDPHPCDVCTANQVCSDMKCVDVCGSSICKSWQKCVEGACKNLCGEDVCPGDLVCIEASCVEKPQDYDPCKACTETQECINGTCVDKDPCLNKTCQDNYRCDREKNGECVPIDPCEKISCGDAQTCIKGRCVDDSCITDMANLVEKSCDEGQFCQKGECIDDGCKDADPCDEGWQCVRGICEETACIEYFCEEGRSCRGGKCIDNECLQMSCNDGLVCSKGACMYEACVGKEACGIGRTCNAEGVCVFNVAPGLLFNETDESDGTDEAGDTFALALNLNNAPTADVRVNCEVQTDSPYDEVAVDCSEIVFNADNWEHEQSVILKGVEDYRVDGDQHYTIKVTTVSEDKDFDGLTVVSPTLVSRDTTKPGFVVSEKSLMTYEDSTQPAATFTVALASIPTADVTISVGSNTLTEGTVSPDSLTFTKDNWDKPQTVTVKGVDDALADGNIDYVVFFSAATSEDAHYKDLHAPDVSVTNVDNDIAGISVNIPKDLVLNEGQSYPLKIMLNTEPSADVTVTMKADDATEAAFESDKIVIAKAEWNAGKDIVLSGVSDFEIDGDQPAKLTFTAASDDEAYKKADPAVYNITVKDVDIADIVATPNGLASVKEGSNDTVTLGVQLTSKPKKDVKVKLAVADDTELKLSETLVTIKANHWDMPHNVTVSSVDDDLVDGNIKSKVTLSSESDDANFNGKTKEIEFTTVDNDVAGFVIGSNATTFTENGGGVTTVTVALAAQPAANVTVDVVSSDMTELTVTSASQLTFTKENWNQPQTVNIKVMDDNIADGTQTATINFSGTSSDATFNGISGKSSVYTIIDNEAPSVVMTVDLEALHQGHNTAVASIVLGAPPASDVTVTLLTSNGEVIAFDKGSLTFTSENWNTPQIVNVTADFAQIATAVSNETIWATAAGGAYNGIKSSDVELTMKKIDEILNFEYTGQAQSVTLPIGRYKLEVWGAQGGTMESGWTGIGGRGGYSVGTINLTAETTLYVFVGQQGQGFNSSRSTHYGGWNGGGYCYQGASGGGGGTDIRVAAEDLYSRVIVAGGGGGSNDYENGGVGGGLTGGTGVVGRSGGVAGTGASQTAGGSGWLNGTFGQGAGSPDNYGDGGSGGGGWYGGGKGNAYATSGGGGSGYVYTSDTAKDYPDGCKLTETYYLTNAQTIAGNASFPAPGGGNETGHPGNGYARISLVY